MKYPAHFLPDTGGFVVTFRDIPEAITQGDDEADAILMAKDVLLSSMGQEIDRLTGLGHSTKMDRIEDALAALGRQLELSATPQEIMALSNR